MLLLIAGLVIFLGIHSLRIVADDWRSTFIAKRGKNSFKGLYSILSLLGLVLIVVGYGNTRVDPVFVWHPPAALSHVAALLMVFSFVLLVAAYVPGNRLKVVVGHPMVLGVKIWAFAHLLANGRLGDMILFGAFLTWAVIDYVHSRKRDRAAKTVRTAEPGITRNGITIAVGVLAWILFAMWGHVALIGVSPFGA